MLIDATLFLALSFIFYVGFLQAFYVSSTAMKVLQWYSVVSRNAGIGLLILHLRWPVS